METIVLSGIDLLRDGKSLVEYYVYPWAGLPRIKVVYVPFNICFVYYVYITDRPTYRPAFDIRQDDTVIASRPISNILRVIKANVSKTTINDMYLPILTRF